jgi:hypothetical protein
MGLQWNKGTHVCLRAAVRIQVGYETQHSKIGRCSDQAVVDCSIDESLPCWSDSLSRRYRMRLALHVILRLDQEDCILGRGLTPTNYIPTNRLIKILLK